ncbi:hypothetical protein [Deinococcus aquatilis]|uniref:hypothetical protein n=1 Tax=Deinococcus aquatilis TaxID=519440 RepID=UPI00035CA9C5|nr:hypothetical protein [Deinococcus aquatilis]
MPGTRCDLALVDRPAGLGLIRAQLLSRGSAAQGLQVLEELTPPGELLREDLGEIVDSSYRNARHSLNDMTGENG